MAGNKQEDKHSNNINHFAVVVRDAEICYKKGQTVLNGMNISVPHGSIYCLLGSSGCGKTTLLSCILGQRKLDRGEIRIYSEKPGTKASGVPGRNVGYMPQEISLYPEFSMEETLFYFGGLVGMEKDTISDKVKVMMNLVDLPSKRRVGTLSGGQQRLVSLAAALIHSPKLLILDEPTVGVDPILRQRLWEHMRTLVQRNGTTVIMSSHYIEECRLADFIGVIRDGRLLLEQTPKQLFRQHGSDNLESIILNFCRAGSSTITESATGLITEANDITTTGPAINTETTHCQSSPEIQQSMKRLQALASKNITVQLRTPRLLAYNLLNQALVLIVICVTLGQIPINLGLGIVNHEAGNSTICNIVHDRCSASTLSCRFLRSIPAQNFNLKMYGTEREAIAAVQTGELWGYASLPLNFSIDFVDRLLTGIYADENNFNNSQILIRLDQTDAQITMSIKMLLYRAYNNFFIKFDGRVRF